MSYECKNCGQLAPVGYVCRRCLGNDYGNINYWRQAQQTYQLPPSYGEWYDQMRADAYALCGVSLEATIPREAPSIEEQRKALKAGDRINSGDMLAPGMRITVATMPGPYVVRERMKDGWAMKSPGHWIADWSWGQQDSLAVYFAGWADEGEAKPTSEETYTSYVRATGEGRAREWRHATYGVRIDLSPIEEPKPRALPFKRHPQCLVRHETDVLCTHCEDWIEGEMATRDRYRARPEPTRPEPHTLAPSGMCGPVLSKLR